MAIVVRRVRLDSDQEDLIGFLQANLPSIPHGRRFRWVYHENPDGRAWSWFACDTTARRIAGVASLFPRSMWVGSSPRTCGQVGDFAIDARYRSLGPAVLLQRATFEPVDEGILSFCYDCPPHGAGMSTFRRLGMKANCAMWRYARPLRVDRQVEKRIGRRFWTGPVVAAGNLLLRVRLLAGHSSYGLEIVEHTGRFDEEFSKLDEKLAMKAHPSIRGRRQAAILNWRYRDDPLQDYCVLTARAAGELVGFLVISKGAQDATITDVRGLPEVAESLLEAAVQYCNRCSIQTVCAVLSDENELAHTLREAAFRVRSTSCHIVAYSGHSTVEPELSSGALHWQFQKSEIVA